MGNTLMVAMAGPYSTRRQDSPNQNQGELVETLRELALAFGEAKVQLTLNELTNQAHQGSTAALFVLQNILREIVFSTNPQLEAEIFALGAGVLLEDNQTMGRVAAKHGLTKQAVSKRVVAFCEKWQLPPSAFMRSERDRRTYALTNKPRVT